MSNNKAEGRAPAVIKLFGEHAVVFGERAVGAAVSMYASSHVENGPASRFSLLLKDYGVGQVLPYEALSSFYNEYKSMEINDYIEKHNDIAKSLPYVTIASRLIAEYGANLDGAEVFISSEIPIGKGLASSAACSLSFTVSLINYCKLNISDNEIIDIARDGERVAHANPNAGAIDVSTSYHGGYVNYNNHNGATVESVPFAPKLLIIDTGPKKSTAETVRAVSELYSKDRSYAEQRIKSIGKCSEKGMSAFLKGDFIEAGRQMVADHNLLRELGVSTELLDYSVKTAAELGAYGAKLSGGGGGGILIALVPADSASRIAEKFQSMGMQTNEVNITFYGAGSYLHNRKEPANQLKKSES
jgi:mevalonate kinase